MLAESDGILIKIFEPYFTTKHQGTGIGLFMCKKLFKTYEWKNFNFKLHFEYKKQNL